MFKKKPIYIVGIVIFTLILVADLAIYLLAPTVGMPSFGGGTFPSEAFEGEMPEGFDSESFNPENFAGRMPGFSAGGGFMGAVRNLFWPVLIVCILGDALCVFMLIRISKKGTV